MTGFDIKTLVDFQPPKYLCKSCKGILFNVDIEVYKFENKSEPAFICPICDQVYIADEIWPSSYLRKYSGIEFNDLLGHSQRLAKIIKVMETKGQYESPAEALLRTFLEAKQFIHFTTWGISSYFVGALKLVGTRISVRGIVSNPNEYVTDELEDNHSPCFEVKIFQGVHPGSYDKMPHQKLIVIDGLIAFKGSANLTTNSWKKAAEGKDLIEVVTNTQEIANLHNRLFAPNWMDDGPRKPIMCEEEIPF